MYLLIIAAIIAVIAAVLLYLSYRLFRYTCLRKPDTDEIEGAFADYKKLVRTEQEWMRENITETLEVISFDGLRLHAALIPASGKARGVVIAMHGYGSRYNLDFAPQARFYHALGYHMIFPMQRAHYGSEGEYISFGVKERFDVKLWSHKAAELFGDNITIILAGISMGASSVMMSAQLTLPDNVRGIISDCGFTSPWAIITHVAKRSFHLPAFPLAYLTDFWAKRIAGFHLKEAGSIDAMKVSIIPVLFIHGKDDTFVPVSMTEENYAACRAPKEKLLIPGAKHAQAYVVDPSGYEKAVVKFMKEIEN